MKARINIYILLIALSLTACKKDSENNAGGSNGTGSGNVNGSGSGGTGTTILDTSTALKSATDIPIGTAAGYADLMIDANYGFVMKRDFNAITVENELKHASVIQSNGSFDYSRADAVINAANGLQIHGHTLAWHSQQNATYLKSYSGLNSATSAELLSGNTDFENGNSNWSIFNTNGATISFVTNDGPNAHGGIGYLKVENSTAYGNNQWKVQVASALIYTVPNTSYVVSYWVKAANAGGSIRLSTQDQNSSNAQYQGDQTIGTSYQQISWTFTTNSTQTRFLFDLGQVANTYFIDDASFREVNSGSNNPQVVAKLDDALKTFINTTVTRYKNIIHSWDVVNELFSETGSLRNNANTLAGNNIFVWSEYLGRDLGLKAFQYAAAADPSATLYINDYNLEWNNRKLDSLISYVTEIKGKGAKVDGIGTQMHVALNVTNAGVDLMFQKLAATGLKIKISELDVKTMNGAGGGRTAQLDAAQAAMAKYIVATYLKYIPKAQQGGITIWGITDKYSWLSNNGTEFPLLYDNNYQKKPSYLAFLQALKGQ